MLDNKYYSQVEQENVPVSNVNKELRSDYTFPISVIKNDYMQGASGMQFNSRELSIVNQPLIKIFANLLQNSESRIIISDQSRYDVRFKIPENLPREKINSAIIQSILNELDYRLTIKIFPVSIPH